MHTRHLGKSPLLDRFEEVPLRVVHIHALHVVGLLAGKVLDPLFGLEVPLHIEQLVLRIDQREGMAAEPIHVAIALRRPAVAEQDRHLVQALRRKRPEVPHHRRRLQVRLRVALLGMDKIAELQGVADKEHRRVVADHVPVALFGIELQRKPARIALRVRGALLAILGCITARIRSQRRFDTRRDLPG